MTLKELKEFIDSLPEEFLYFQIVNGEVGRFDDEDDNLRYRIDKPITAAIIDEGTKEVVLANNSVPYTDDGVKPGLKLEDDEDIINLKDEQKN